MSNNHSTRLLRTAGFLSSGFAAFSALAAFVVVAQPLPAASQERVVVKCSRNDTCRERVVRRIVPRVTAPTTSVGISNGYEDFLKWPRPCGYANKC